MKGKINRKSKHVLRRIAIAIIPLSVGIIIGLIRLKLTDKRVV